jgi:hypothetical protein
MLVGQGEGRPFVLILVTREFHSSRLSLSFKQNRLSENLGAEHEAKSKLRWLAQAAVLSAGWRWAGPVRLPFGRPGDLPHGFGGSA